ncbi:hypothetical protein ABN034_05320 [Actinopolymorpha sp. B11F2]|uniref:hypothetical protein n=1 Tax=Actinopolymorpha sp. B11F2 TaxID=3160862 RepID=UPI0032E4F01A
MAWDSGWRDASPDVAEVVDPPRRGPGWARPVAVALVLLVAGLLLFARLTSSAVRAEAAPAAFLDSYTVELAIQLTNSGDDHLEITPDLRPLAGMEFRGARDTARQPVHAQHPIQLPAQGRTTLSLTWQVTDCVPARAAKATEIALPMLVRPFVGAADTMDVSAGTLYDLTPAVCDQHPGRGVPRLVGQEVTPGPEGVSVALDVFNGGGRPLTFRAADLPAGWIHLNNVTASPATDRQIPVGHERTVRLRFAPHDCSAPIEGPAMLKLRFDSGDGTRSQLLSVRLAESWANLLGVCSPEY